MQIKITGHQLDITDAIKEHIENKAQKLKRHFDQVMNLHFILETTNHRIMKAEATLHSAGKDGFAKDESNDMYKSIDSVIEKLDRQMKKHQEKLNKHN